MSEYPPPISYVGEVKVNSTDPKASGFYDQLNQVQYDALQQWKKDLVDQKVLQNIKVEADALKVRLLNEIADEEAKLNPAPKDDDDGNGGGQTPPPPSKKKKTVSIKSVSAATTWQIETIEDVDEYLKDLRKKLIGTLEDNTIVNIEF